MNCLNEHIRLPAEWEPQDAILLAWPDDQTDWKSLLPEIQALYHELIDNIIQHEKVVLICRNLSETQKFLSELDIDFSRLIFAEAPFNDTWCRDFGPLTIYNNKHPVLLDYKFNGWGEKFDARLDNQVTIVLYDKQTFGPTHLLKYDLVLEGGSIESDGQGTILTTSACLLNKNRNPQMDKLEIENTLKTHFGAEQVLWLEHGFLAGDDTDSHIDTLARLCPDNTILYVHCDDPADEHYCELDKMLQQLKTFRTLTGEPFNLHPLPCPNPVFSAEGERLPATYANFLVINSAVLVPVYGDPADKSALEIIKKAYPNRTIIPIDCRVVIQQNGSLHCLTMQIPEGVLP